MTVDLHGYHPYQDDLSIEKIVQQAWEMGETQLKLIHGHGFKRGKSPGFVNTNTGFFGLVVRRQLRHDKTLRQWIKHTTLDCSDIGCTTVGIKRNPSPTRKAGAFDCLPERLD